MRWIVLLLLVLNLSLSGFLAYNSYWNDMKVSLIGGMLLRAMGHGPAGEEG